ncbi:four-helix bundle copper-binding protein [Planomicrobium sp. CPCC 101110]|uniref:four-helix bundle copper-binding protein n=1 Tax=Planomicrobium sp. CPCC 101110 TaxID=2599619 RepID=UPI0011B58CA8|nr:four-helix bundle copper-binding protein [Planomicrobium sp. CPCC 101110]TWT25985.1 four-helix bundle copper-binding protein [Planomicrobium sp. CPCC 101110]
MAHEQHQELIQILHDCAAACNHCFYACLQEDDVKMMAECIRTDRECADICAFLEQAITRNSPFIAELAAVCAKVCEACGKECEKHADHHEHCRRCAEACFKCAEACRNIA